MDHSDSTPPAPHLAPIGDETLSVVNWLSALPHLWPWIGIGLFLGTGLMLACLGMAAQGEIPPKFPSALMVWIGTVLIFVAVSGIYIAGRRYAQREEMQRRRIRAERTDELQDQLARERSDMRAAAEEEDRRWSADPFQFFAEIAPLAGAINCETGTLTFDVQIRSLYTKRRIAWFSGGIALCAANDGNHMFIGPLQVLTFDIAPGSVSRTGLGIPLNLDPSIIRAVRANRCQWRVVLVDASISTLAHLTADVAMVTKKLIPNPSSAALEIIDT